jgi:hypothetical protein
MFSLLACGSMVLSIVSVVRFFARGAKKRTTVGKYHAAAGKAAFEHVTAYVLSITN